MVTKVINFTHSPLSMYLESLETYHDHEFSVILLFQQWMWLQHFLSNPQNSSAQKWSRHIFIHLGGYQVKTCQEPHLTAGASALRRFDRTRQSWEAHGMAPTGLQTSKRMSWTSGRAIRQARARHTLKGGAHHVGQEPIVCADNAMSGWWASVHGLRLKPKGHLEPNTSHSWPQQSRSKYDTWHHLKHAKWRNVAKIRWS